MAIQLDKDLKKFYTLYVEDEDPQTIEGRFLAGYNPNTIRWHSDTDLVVKSGAIWINDYKFEGLVPNSESRFFFNLYEVAKAELGNFDDDYLNRISDVVKYDQGLFKKLTIKLWIKFDDDSTEQYDTEIYITRAVHQIGNPRGESLFDFEPLEAYNDVTPAGTYAIRRPLLPSRDEVAKLRVFKGYPLDVTVIDAFDRTSLAYGLIPDIESGEETVQGDATISTSDNCWIKRLQISDGASLIPILAGQKNIRLVMSSTKEEEETFYRWYLDLEIVDTCGMYLKWLNSEGGWSYWLFHKYFKQPFTAKSRGSVSRNIDTLAGESGNLREIGMDADVNIQVFDQGLRRWQYEHVVELATSPIVYLYIGAKDALPTAGDWLLLTRDQFKGLLQDNRRQAYDLSFEFNLPGQYTQTL